MVWNPEFLREGFAVQDTTAPDRIVYGIPEDRERGEIGRAALDRVYAPILERGTPRLLVNYPTAELVKVAANSFLATKISFINSMAELCDATGGDVARLPRRSGTTSASAASSFAPASASAAAASRRTSAPSWPAPASSASTSR